MFEIFVTFTSLMRVNEGDADSNPGCGHTADKANCKICFPPEK